MITILSVLMTAIALFGISVSQSFIVICFLAIQLGVGAGSIDAALNNFGALHYKATHMNWLHSFWGLGTVIGPVILSSMLLNGGTWNKSYFIISCLQFGLAMLLLITLPLWKKIQRNEVVEEQKSEPIHFLQVFRIKKAKPTLITFFCYCSLEATVILWGASYLVIVRKIEEGIASGWISLFFIGITLGRMLSGFLAMKWNQRQLIRLGQIFIIVGVTILMLPFYNYMLLVGLFSIGIGCAPIYPSLIHETPNTFGKERSQSLMGIQMASAYVGSTFIPPLFGFIGSKLGYGLFPYFLGLMLVIMIISVSYIYKKETNV